MRWMNELRLLILLNSAFWVVLTNFMHTTDPIKTRNPFFSRFLLTELPEADRKIDLPCMQG